MNPAKMSTSQWLENVKFSKKICKKCLINKIIGIFWNGNLCEIEYRRGNKKYRKTELSVIYEIGKKNVKYC